MKKFGVFLAVSLCLIGGYYFFGAPSHNRDQKKILLRNRDIIQESFSWVSGLNIAPNKTIGSVECAGLNDCQKGEFSQAGGNLWPLLAYVTAFKALGDQSALSKAKAYGPMIGEVLSGEHANPVSNFFNLYEGFKVTKDKALLTEFVNAMGTEINRMRDPVDVENMYKRNTMVFAQLSRQSAELYELMNNPALMDENKDIPYIGDAFLLDIEQWKGIAKEALLNEAMVLEREILSESGAELQRPDLCWGIYGLSYISRALSDKRLEEKVTYALKVMHDPSGYQRHFKELPSAHSYLPCLDVLTAFSTPTNMALKKGAVQDFLNRFFDSSKRPICNGDGATMASSNGWLPRATCQDNSKFVSDQSWLVHILARFPMDEQFELDL